MIKYEIEYQFHIRVLGKEGVILENSYVTKQGEAILSLLKEEEGRHFTAESIVNRLAQRNISVGKATVYRHLDKLVNRGLVRRYIVGEGECACYEYVGDSSRCSDHNHLKCSECGRLIHVECKYLDEVVKHVFDHHGFMICPEKTVFYGVCSQCMEEKNEK